MNHNRGALSPLVANSLLVVAAVAGSLLLCEPLLRLLGLSYPVLDWTDPVRGVAFIPGAKGPPQSDGGSSTEGELGLRDEVQLPPSTSEWTEAWRITEGVLVLTRNIQVSPDKQKKEEFLCRLGATDRFYPERCIADLGKREGVQVLNLARPMAKEAEERQVYFHSLNDQMGVGHWNVEGNRAAGELIAVWVASQFADRTMMEGQAQHAHR
jgi:hypothetical protein